MIWDEKTIEKIRQGYFSAVYFNRTKQILLAEKNTTSATMQIFQKHDDVTICGIDEVVELFKVATGYFDKNTWVDTFSELTIETLKDGDVADGWETVMHITGPYAYFAHLESLYLGILARQTRIATNTKKVVEAARGKDVIFFADRFDSFVNQESDGYGARIGGAAGVATEAQAKFWDKKPMGTIPHALIAMEDGNTVAAAEKFVQQFPDVPLIVVVDFENDCIKTSLDVAKKFGKKLFGVRLDTSEKMVDVSVAKEKLTGVNPLLVKRVRKALDDEGFSHVKIIVSGGFNKEKIELFESEQTPVDIYGVGSSLVKGENDFTADIVKVNAKSAGKTGRTFRPNTKLQKIT
ncbi:MAG: nicotinate phosphoribosyltransferase [Candidatus Levyibacteriota bacterium]